ncbi:hypothetical protein Tco_0574084 [Tanacetum coccineum]
MIFNINSEIKHSYSNDDTRFSIDVIDEIFEEDFDAPFNEGSEILHSIEGTILDKKLFAEFDEFMAMIVDENLEFKSGTKEPPFKTITFNTDYKIKTSLKALPMDLELKPLPEFDIKIKDKKGTENVAVYHLSRIENDEKVNDSEVDDNFPRETLMEINTRDKPWFADFANYLVSDIIPKGMTYQQKNKIFSDLNTTSGRIPTSLKYVLMV